MRIIFLGKIFKTLLRQNRVVLADNQLLLKVSLQEKSFSIHSIVWIVLLIPFLFSCLLGEENGPKSLIVNGSFSEQKNGTFLGWTNHPKESFEVVDEDQNGEKIRFLHIHDKGEKKSIAITQNFKPIKKGELSFTIRLASVYSLNLSLQSKVLDNALKTKPGSKRLSFITQFSNESQQNNAHIHGIIYNPMKEPAFNTFKRLNFVEIGQIYTIKLKFNLNDEGGSIGLGTVESGNYHEWANVQVPPEFKEGFETFQISIFDSNNEGGEKSVFIGNIKLFETGNVNP